MSTGLGDKAVLQRHPLQPLGRGVRRALGYLDLRFTQVNWRELYPNLTRLQDKLHAAGESWRERSAGLSGGVLSIKMGA